MENYSIDQKMHIKICGITGPDEIQLLDDLGVNFAGLWSGVPEGMRNLSLKQIVSLARRPRHCLKLVLVTLHHALPIMETLVESGGFDGIQLHGFQSPSVVQRIREAFGHTIRIFKVLHVQGTTCVESNLVERYIQAGVDHFILDTFEDRHHIGSTGIALNEIFLRRFIPHRLAADKIMLAGGIDHCNIGRICRDYHPFGVDIDSAARRHGKINKQCVARIIAQMCH